MINLDPLGHFYEKSPFDFGCSEASLSMMIKIVRNMKEKRGRKSEKDLSYVESFRKCGNIENCVSHLGKFGISCSFRYNVTDDDIKRSLDRGIPVPVRILPRTDPKVPRVYQDDLHTVLIVGYRERDRKRPFIWYVHDPVNPESVRERKNVEYGKSLMSELRGVADNAAVIDCILNI